MTIVALSALVYVAVACLFVARDLIEVGVPHDEVGVPATDQWRWRDVFGFAALWPYVIAHGRRWL